MILQDNDGRTRPYGDGNFLFDFDNPYSGPPYQFVLGECLTYDLNVFIYAPRYPAGYTGAFFFCPKCGILNTKELSDQHSFYPNKDLIMQLGREGLVVAPPSMMDMDDDG